MPKKKSKKKDKLNNAWEELLKKRDSNEWFSYNCQHTKSHVKLFDIAYNLIKGDVNKIEYEDIYESGILNIKCANFAALAMDILRFAYFSEDILPWITGVLSDIWICGRRAEKAVLNFNATKPLKVSRKILTAFKLLDNWRSDLPNIKHNYLPQYVQILSFEGLQDKKEFEEIIIYMKDYLLDEVINCDADLVDNTVHDFIKCVLYGLRQNKNKSFMNVLLIATQLSVELFKKKRFKSIAELWNLFKLMKFPLLQNPNHSMPEDRHVIYEFLSNEYRYMSSELLKYYHHWFSNLIPLIGGWPERNIRVEFDSNIEAKFTVESDKYNFEFLGEIIDFCSLGKGFHAKLKDIKELNDATRTYMNIDNTNVEICDLSLTNNLNHSFSFQSCKVEYILPGCLPSAHTVYPIRAWKYHDNPESIGVAFYFEKKLEENKNLKIRRITPGEKNSIIGKKIINDPVANDNVVQNSFFDYSQNSNKTVNIKEGVEVMSSQQQFLNDIERKVIDVLANNFDHDMVIRNIWKLAGGKASLIPKAPNSQHVWYSLWQKAKDGAGATSIAIVREALCELPSNDVFISYLHNEVNDNAKEKANEIIEIIDTLPMEFEHDDIAQIFQGFDKYNQDEVFCSMALALNNRVQPEKRSRLLDLLETMGDIACKGYTSTVEAVSFGATKALLATQGIQL